MNPNTLEDTSNPFLIDSLNHAQAGLIRQLLTREGRVSLNKIIIDDEENIVQAHLSGVKIQSLYYADSRDNLAGVLRVLPEEDVDVFEVKKRTAKKLFNNDRLSRVFAIAEKPKTRSLNTIAQTQKDIVVLEDLSISGNVGSIIRTSLALECGGIVLLNMDSHDIYDRRLIRASRGYVFSLPIIVASTREFIQYCKTKNEEIAVSSIQGTISVAEVSELKRRLILVFGGEKLGTTEEIESAADIKFKIQLNESVESLNVSVAAAITLFSRGEYNRNIINPSSEQCLSAE
jgi:23S rRNA (adenosine1067-2'-O)-methyltransferase